MTLSTVGTEGEIGQMAEALPELSQGFQKLPKFLSIQEKGR